MLDGEIYLWLESRSGSSCDCSDTVASIQKNDLIAIDPNKWLYGINHITAVTKEAINVVKDNAYDIPDNLPGSYQLQRLIARDARNDMRQIIASGFKSLGIQVPAAVSSMTMRDCWTTAVVLTDLIKELANTSIDDVLTSKWYDEYQEDNDDALSEIIHIYPQDLPNIAFAIQDIRELALTEDDDE